MADNRKRFSIKYGSEISLIFDDERGFLSCAGGAHPKLNIRSAVFLEDVLSFEDCVFVVHPPLDSRILANSAHSAPNSSGALASGGARSIGISGDAAPVGNERDAQESASPSSVLLTNKLLLMTTEVTYGAKFLLKHKQTGLFVALHTSQPSELDPDSNVVTLVSEVEAAQSRSALFRFTPRFKMHNEGDYVCQGDQLLLQALSYKLYLHVSEIIGGQSMMMLPSPQASFGGALSSSGSTSVSGTDSFCNSTLPPRPLFSVATSASLDASGVTLEVNASESSSSWIVRRYDIGLESQDVQRIVAKGKPPVCYGTPVALFHRERESLLTSSIAKTQSGGSDVNSDDMSKYRLAGSGYSSTSSSRRRSTSASQRTSAATLETRKRGYHQMSREASSARLSPAFSTVSSAAHAAATVSTPNLRGSRSGADWHRDATDSETFAPTTVYPLLSPYSSNLSNDFSFETIKCTCAAYWVLEHADPTVGGPLRFGEPFRIRQAATNMYLAVTQHEVGNSGGGEGGGAISAGGHFKSGFALRGGSERLSLSSNLGAGLASRSPGNSFQILSSGMLRSCSTAPSANPSGITHELKLALVGTPVTEEAQRMTLFSVHHMFYTEAKVVAETDFFRIQNVESGVWLCTDPDVSVRSEVMMSLQPRPSQHDAWMAGHVSDRAYRDVLHIFFCYDALKRYRDVFAHWTRDRKGGHRDSSLGPGGVVTPDALHEPKSETSSKSKDLKEPPQCDFRTKPYAATIRRCTEALISLIHFCTQSNDKDPFTREGLPIREHQRIMFDLQLHRMVIDVIVAPLVPVHDEPTETTTIDFSGAHVLPALPLGGGAIPKKLFDVKHPEYGALHNISRLGFRLIKQMVLGNPSFAVLLSRYIPLMFELDGMKLHVVEVMHEMFTENSLLPVDELTSAVNHYVNTLVNRQKSAGYLKFLATMCAAHDDEIGIVETQELVCRKLILDVPPEKSVLMPTVLLDTGHVGVMWGGLGSPTSSTESVTPIDRFLTQHPDAKLVKYFEGQIELFAKLSAGCGSTMVAKKLEHLFPSLQLNGVINSMLWTGEEVAGRASKLDPTRCNLYKLAMNLYVRPVLRNPEVQLALNTVLIGSSQIRAKWAGHRVHLSASHSGVADTTIMLSLKHAAMQLLRANSFVVVSDRNRNELLRTVVGVWATFIDYRQYSTEDVQTLVPLLLQLLDGKRDVPSASSLGSFSLQRASSFGSFKGHSSGSMSSQATGRGSTQQQPRTPAMMSPLIPNSVRYRKTEDSVVVMELRRSICRLLSKLLDNMIHEGSDELISYLFTALGGVRGIGATSVEDVDDTLQDCPAKNSRVSLLSRATTSVANFFRRSRRDDETDSPKLSRSASDVTVSISSAQIEAKVSEVCESIEAFFTPSVLVPLVFDVAQYNHEALTTESVTLLTDLTCVRRRVCEKALSVKITPTREMLTQFDRIHLVAVELIAAVDGDTSMSGDAEEFTDAMEMVLKTMLQSYVPKNKIGQMSRQASSFGSFVMNRTMSTSGNSSAFIPPKGSVSFSANSVSTAGPDVEQVSALDTTSNTSAGSRTKSVKFSAGDDDADSNAKPKRTAKVRWAEATTVAKIVAMSKRVQRKRNSLGLDPSSDVPLDVVLRAELMCHWGIHETLLESMDSGRLGPSHPAFIDVMDFFYYFSLSPSNARCLTPHLQLFVNAITVEEVRVQCMHVVVAVMSSRTVKSSPGKHTFGRLTEPVESDRSDEAIDIRILDSIASMIVAELDRREPDASFLKLVSKHLLDGGPGRAALSSTACRQLLHLLHQRNAFRYLAHPKMTRSADLQFNSSMIEVLCGLCRVNRSLRIIVQRVLPHAAIVNVLNRKDRDLVLPKNHQAAYLRVLAEIYFVREDDSSEAETQQTAMLWTEDNNWWSVLRLTAKSIGDFAALLRRPDDNASLLEERGQEKEFWFTWLPRAITGFFTISFDMDALGAQRGEAGEIITDLSTGVVDVATLLENVESHTAFSFTTQDVSTWLSMCRALETTAVSVERCAPKLVERLRMVQQSYLPDLLDSIRCRTQRRDSDMPWTTSANSSIADSSFTSNESNVSGHGSVEGSFFFQGNRRDMTDHEVLVRKVLQRCVPKDTCLSASMVAKSSAATQFVAQLVSLISSHTSTTPSARLASPQSNDNSCASTCTTTGSVQPQKLQPSEVERFIVKLLHHMMRLSYSAETISCLLNLFHVALENPAQLFLLSDDSHGAQRHEEAHSDDVLTVERREKLHVARQVQLDQLGLMRVVTALSDLSDPLVTQSALLVGIALLDGGNATVQNAMLQYFETHDESFFHNVRDILQSCFQRVHNVNEYVVQQLTQSGAVSDAAELASLQSAQVVGGDGVRPAGGGLMRHKSFLRTTTLSAAQSHTGGSPGQPSSVSSNSVVAIAPSAAANPYVFIAEMFRFLQLMCEGHHNGMQNYIRVQSDNLHSINIVQEVLLLVAELCTVRIDAQNHDVVVQGFALLTEFCQGPCVENQSTLLQNDACGLIAVILSLRPLTEVQHSNGRSDLTSLSEVQKHIISVQHAASVTLLSLIEGCSRPEVYHKALSQVPLRLLEALVQQLSRFISDEPTDRSVADGSNSTSSAPLVPRREDSPPEAKPKRRLSLDSDVASSVQDSGAKPKKDAAVANQDIDSDGDSGGDSDSSSDDADDHVEPLLFNLLIFAKSVKPFLERNSDTVGLECVGRMFSYAPSISARLGSIQVEREGIVERVFFPIPEICLSLTHKSKDEVLWAVDRTSRVTKLSDFSQKIDELMFEMNSTHRCAKFVEEKTRFTSAVALGAQLSSGAPPRFSLKTKAKLLWNSRIASLLFSSDSSFYETRALIVGAAVNLLFVVTDGVDRDETTTSIIEAVVVWMCLALLALDILVLVFDSVVYLPVFFYRRYRQDLRSIGVKHLSQQVELDDVLRHFTTWAVRIRVGARRFTTIYYLLMVAAAFAALTVNPYFAAVHLLGLIYRSAQLRTVIVAITQNGKSLALTMGLGVIIVYMFSVVGYMHFPKAFDSGASIGQDSASQQTGGFQQLMEPQDTVLAPQQENCQTLGRCFTFILTNGLRQGGGVGDLMQTEPWDSPILAPRMGFDFAFYALVNVVFLNILFGIIIDTFAELRDDKRRKEEDMNTCCFICGLDAEVFEKDGGGFRRHVQQEHNMWQYLYFVYHLRLKDPNDFTGQESYVYREMLRGSLAYFPDGKCLSLVKSHGHLSDDPRGDATHTTDGEKDGADGAGLSAAAAAALRSGTVQAVQSAVVSAVRTEVEGLRDQILNSVKSSADPSTTSNTFSAVSGGGGPMNATGNDLVHAHTTGTYDFASSAAPAAVAIRRRSRTVGPGDDGRNLPHRSGATARSPEPPESRNSPVDSIAASASSDTAGFTDLSSPLMEKIQMLQSSLKAEKLRHDAYVKEVSERVAALTNERDHLLDTVATLRSQINHQEQQALPRQLSCTRRDVSSDELLLLGMSDVATQTSTDLEVAVDLWNPLATASTAQLTAKPSFIIDPLSTTTETSSTSPPMVSPMSSVNDLDLVTSALRRMASKPSMRAIIRAPAVSVVAHTAVQTDDPLPQRTTTDASTVTTTIQAIGKDASCQVIDTDKEETVLLLKNLRSEYYRVQRESDQYLTDCRQYAVYVEQFLENQARLERRVAEQEQQLQEYEHYYTVRLPQAVEEGVDNMMDILHAHGIDLN